MILRITIPTVAVLLSLVIRTVSAQSCCESYCYNNDLERKQVQHFATKTAYEVIRVPDTDKQHIVPSKPGIAQGLLSTSLVFITCYSCRLPTGEILGP